MRTRQIFGELDGRPCDLDLPGRRVIYHLNHPCQSMRVRACAMVGVVKYISVHTAVNHLRIVERVLEIIDRTARYSQVVES